MFEREDEEGGVRMYGLRVFVRFECMVSFV
jgi:hypothetical protein